VGFEHYAELPEKVLSLLSDGAEARAGEGLGDVLVGEATVPFRQEEDRVSLTLPHTAYIRVAEGCDHACTFCAIPGFRGAFRSKPYDTVVAEAARLVDRGVRELCLIAEDTNQYGHDWKAADSRRLADLLHDLAALPGLRWIRLLYCYPSYFSPALIEAIGSIDKVVKYIDIPLQHLSPTVLSRMNRPSGQSTLKLLRTLRAAVPTLTLRTTFISGFPGETDAEHRELVNLARELGFERGGAFAYSQEEGTPAANLDDQLDPETKERRRDELIAAFQQHAEEWANRQVGTELRVLVDRVEGEDAIGRTEADAPDIDGSIRLLGCAHLQPGTELLATVAAADVMELVATPSTSAKAAVHFSAPPPRAESD